MRTTQRIPTHITVDSVDTASRLCGPAWTRLTRGRARLAALRSHQFAGDLTRIVRHVDSYSDLDFELLCSTADWFRHHGQSARGLTPRQVPVPGIQAKWLNSRHGLVAALADQPDLGLLPPHPARPRLFAAIRSTNCRTVGWVGGLPRRQGLVQRRGTRSRCQRRTVSGVTDGRGQRLRRTSRRSLRAMNR